MSDTPEIDYDMLATLVATKLRTHSMAYAQGQTALEDVWLREQVLSIIDNNSAFTANTVFRTYEFEQAFKLKLRTIFNNVY